MNPKKYKDLVYDIIGAALKVHNEMNWGLLEALYAEAMHIELELMGITSQLEVELPCYYKGRKMNKTYRADLVVGDVMVELKATSDIIPAHRAQLFNYMRLTRLPIGLIINFGRPSLQGERYAFCQETNECILLDRNMDFLLPADSVPSYDDALRFSTSSSSISTSSFSSPQ